MSDLTTYSGSLSSGQESQGHGSRLPIMHKLNDLQCNILLLATTWMPHVRHIPFKIHHHSSLSPSSDAYRLPSPQNPSHCSPTSRPLCKTSSIPHVTRSAPTRAPSRFGAAGPSRRDAIRPVMNSGTSSRHDRSFVRQGNPDLTSIGYCSFISRSRGISRTSVRAPVAK